MESFTVAMCKLSDCLFYKGPEPADANKCRCSHPEKAHYLKESRCPLYRMDWQKKMQAAQSLMAKVKAR